MIDLEPARMIEKIETSRWKDFETMWKSFKCQLEDGRKNFEEGGD